MCLLISSLTSSIDSSGCQINSRGAYWTFSHNLLTAFKNVVAGVTATRFLPPLNELFKPEDSIYSSFAPTTAFGRAVLYTALYEGINITHFPSSVNSEISI